MKYRLEKTKRIVQRLNAIQRLGDETLVKVAEIIREKAIFYDDCRRVWDTPQDKFNPEEIVTGKACCEAGLDMADAITNVLRIRFIEKRRAK